MNHDEHNDRDAGRRGAGQCNTPDRTPACDVVDLARETIPGLRAGMGLPVEAQIDAWAEHMRSAAPDLLAVLIAGYGEEGADWRQVAREHVWPKLPGNLDAIEEARSACLAVCGPIHERCASGLDISFPVLFVLYVGIGCGAGWATHFRDRDAVLVGLENAAELGWTTPETLGRMLAHELGHLLLRRARGPEPCGDGPLWDLFEEGFAQHAEHVALGARTWGCSSQDGWVEWCNANEGELAARFLVAADDRDAARPFFGSWYEIQGWRQTGYYLGCRVVEEMLDGRTPGALAGMPKNEIDDAVRIALAAMAAGAELTT